MNRRDVLKIVGTTSGSFMLPLIPTVNILSKNKIDEPYHELLDYRQIV